MGEFADSVFDIVVQIPKGKVATYGQIARMLGRPRSARYVGYALRSNPRPGADADSIPCHRVVFKDGSLCKGFAFGGPGVQQKLLEDEGILFVNEPATDGVALSDCDDADLLPKVDMKKCQWDGRMPDKPRGDYPTEPPADFDWAAELGEL